MKIPAFFCRMETYRFWENLSGIYQAAVPGVLSRRMTDIVRDGCKV